MDPNLGGLHPLPFHRLTDGTMTSLFLSPHPCLLVGGAFHLQICSILGQVGIPPLVMAEPEAPVQDRECSEKIES
jgi:hypothetical protein